MGSDMEAVDETRNTDGRWAGTHTKRFAGAAAVLALAVAGGTWVALTGSGGDPSGTGATQEPPATSQANQEPLAPVGGEVAAPSASAGAESVCGLVPGDLSVPTGALGARTTTAGRGLKVPFLDGVGPGATSPLGVSSCYAHSPRGAVLSAGGFMTWFSSKQQLLDMVHDRMEAGPDRNRLAAKISQTWGGEIGAPLQIRGYKATLRSPDEVVVTLAVVQAGDSRLVSWPLTMVWSEGDWRVRVPNNEAWGEEAITSLEAAGMSPWQ